MRDKEQRAAAKLFADRWKNRGYEKGESQSFWIDLLEHVLGVENGSAFITFEDQVHLDHTSFIDGYIPSTKVLIEQKGLGKNMRKAIPQSDGTLLTPFQQAKRYITELPLSQHPRWVVTCNFESFYVYDMEKPGGEPEKIDLANLEKEYYRLNFLVDSGNENLKREMEISIAAGDIVGILYDALLKQYKDPTNVDSLKSLNMLCVRLVFCLYAEDAGIFGKHLMFHDYMEQYAAKDWRKELIQLFRVLDTKAEERDPYLNEDLAAFPYVNGGLFSEESIEIPQFTEEIRNIILVKSSEGFDWSEISPTIFGAVFESTLNPETRRSGGMHYTSIENIHKVIDPLFLDDLKAEFEDIKAISVERARRAKLTEFQNKLASLKFLDPACGSGNFLTESFLSLRRLENEVIFEISGGQMTLGDVASPIKISIQQFYGIEINDFAVTVAKTALWIAESQMMKETEAIVHMVLDFLPLKTNAHIVEGNALRIDWESVVPKGELNYIMGNPPFVGARNQSENQKQDILTVCMDKEGEMVKRAGFIDYVGGWYFKASRYIVNTQVSCAFVSTNSICQGEQVEIIWKNLYDNYNIRINFAYQTFVWDSEATIKAHVHCVIIGFSQIKKKKKQLWLGTNKMRKVEYINAYLLPAPECFIKRLNRPLFDVPIITNGNRAYDGNNLVMTKDEKDELIKDEPYSEKYIKPYFMGADLMKGQSRFVLWLVDCPPDELRRMPLVMKRVKAVQEMREGSSNSSTRKAAMTPALFQTICQPTERYIGFPRVSSSRRRYIPMTFLNPDIICGDKLIIIPKADNYIFGVLMSNVHNAWIRVVSGRLKSDIEYSSSVYNNFPWPDITDEQKARIRGTAQMILDARAKYPNSSLADLYDDLTMPPELRKAHNENDKAVLAAYGFKKGTPEYSSESACVAALMRLYQEKVNQL